MKIKLKDMTYNQYRRWKEENCSYKTCKKCVFNRIACGYANKEVCWVNNKNVYSDEFLDQEIEVESEENEIALSEEEKNALRAILNFFGNRVERVERQKQTFGNYIYLWFYDSIYNFRFPLFNNYEFKGMKYNRIYTLKELELGL